MGEAAEKVHPGVAPRAQATGAESAVREPPPKPLLAAIHRAKLSTAGAFIAGCVAIFALSWAREVLIPIALATLLSFLLTPIVARLERFGLGRLSSVGIAIIASFLVLSGVGYLMFDQIGRLALELPSYRANIRSKAQSIEGPLGGPISRVSAAFREIRQDLPFLEKQAAPTVDMRSIREGEAIPVEVKDAPDAWHYLRFVLGSVVAPLATGALVLLLSIFMLLYREDLRNRVIRLAGPRHLSRTTYALDDATARVSRYLRMQFAINASFGIAVGLGLWGMGMPNALLWGSFSAIMRYVPYLGPWVSALVPIVLSVAIFPTWAGTLQVIALFSLLELICNNVVEPFVYGSSTGLSSPAVVAAAVFWTWIWGPVGLLMSTPLTVCLVVAGKHVPSLDFLHVLLGDEPVLTPSDRLYQRLLAGDGGEAAEVVEDYLVEHSIEDLYDNVIVPALCLCAQELHSGGIDAAGHSSVRESIEDMVEELMITDTRMPAPVQSEDWIACVPARDQDDAIGALMLEHVLARSGIPARVLSRSLAGEVLDALKQAKGAAIVALSGPSLNHGRYLLKRARMRYPAMKMMAVISCDLDRGATRERLAERTGSRVSTCLREAPEVFRG